MGLATHGELVPLNDFAEPAAACRQARLYDFGCKPKVANDCRAPIIKGGERREETEKHVLGVTEAYVERIRI